jgi:preprotein translocase subunit SecA
VDEARTPLIISSPTRMATEGESIVYQWADSVAKQMKPGSHFRHDIKKDKIEITDAGRELVRYSKPPVGEHSKAMDKLFEAIEKAIQANFRLVLDHHYMILKDKIVIVDESTGGRCLIATAEGLHQAVEARARAGSPCCRTRRADHLSELFPPLRTSERYGGIIQNFREMRASIAAGSLLHRLTADDPQGPTRSTDSRCH